MCTLGFARMISRSLCVPATQCHQQSPPCALGLSSQAAATVAGCLNIYPVGHIQTVGSCSWVEESLNRQFPNSEPCPICWDIPNAATT